jgi:hypothetical protein
MDGHLGMQFGFVGGNLLEAALDALQLLLKFTALSSAQFARGGDFLLRLRGREL